MTCAASILLTSKPVDVIFRPLHAAKRSREHKPYRALQSTLPLMCRSPLQLDSLEREKIPKETSKTFIANSLLANSIRFFLFCRVRVLAYIFHIKDCIRVARISVSHVFTLNYNSLCQIPDNKSVDTQTHLGMAKLNAAVRNNKHVGVNRF